MTDTADRDFTHLPPAAAGLGSLFAQPKTVAVACVIALTGLGWFYLGVLTSGMSTLDALCRAATGSPFAAGSVALIASMWVAMTLAMMLPSAAPMILAYTDIAEAAARKGEPIVSPFAIAAGYTAVWLGFAAIATLVQIVLTSVALVESSAGAAAGLFSGALFIVAGLYQFSALKHACLTQCQRPFPFFFANWATTPRGVFRLGLKQGLYCLGCCWAMMLVMLAAGVMNVVWMAALGAVMTIEKIGTGRRFSSVVGLGLIAIGIAFVAAPLAAHWPGHFN
jgi:predicted metal-binding membrane protein